jgi:hypothetical protein
MPQSEFVILEVFNMLGQKVETVIGSQIAAGTHEITFDAKNRPSGIYIYRFQAGRFRAIRKMILLR